MYYKLLQLLNIKPHESAVVRKLFTIQFFLGVGAAFLFTSSLTMFLSAYTIKTLPIAYILSAGLLFVFNPIYSHLDEKFSSPRLLAIVILFSAFSTLLFWTLLNLAPFKQLPLIIAAWYMLLYMLIGYAFWGMASILFNVRESKRVFSIVGAGDIPAKMLGYFSVTALVPFIGVNNLLWVSIISFFIAWYLLNNFKKTGLFTDEDPNAPVYSNEHQSASGGFLSRLLNNRLVLFIAILSLLSYTVFSFIDFTFLSDIKMKFHHDEEMATFIAVFFAIGRCLAVAIKVLFSSRMIARIGLTYSLLVTPLLLISVAFFIVISGNRIFSHLYIFGFMVLLTEILRSTLQEPVFFILFQPLKPHDRLRGHLVAKGQTMPFALLGVGLFLVLYFQKNQELPVVLTAQIIISFLFLWVGTVYLIKNEYLTTLIASLKKGYFTGTELFLHDSSIMDILRKKTESKNPLEVIHSLNLLERSGYSDIYRLLIKNIQNANDEIRAYVLYRIVANDMTAALPFIKQLLKEPTTDTIKLKLLETYYFLNKESTIDDLIYSVNSLEKGEQKAAIQGLLKRNDEKIEQLVIERLSQWIAGSTEDKMLAVDVMIEYPCRKYTPLLRILLHDREPALAKKAIEAAGKANSIELLPDIVELAMVKGFDRLRAAVVYFGDNFFKEQDWQNKALNNDFLLFLIKTAGIVKGDHSTIFLVDVLRKKNNFFNEIIGALWRKKAALKPEEVVLINDNLDQRIDKSNCKVNYYHDIANVVHFDLLQRAFMSELRQDLQVFLKVLALCYSREKMDRIIQLMQLEKTKKLSNAIEVLELTIPKKYFLQVNNIWNLLDDVEHKDLIVHRTNDGRTTKVIAEILKENRANFSEWTKSVACYMLPKMKKSEAIADALNVDVSKEDRLFAETRNYVLTMVK